jgi:hypothetical protein
MSALTKIFRLLGGTPQLVHSRAVSEQKCFLVISPSFRKELNSWILFIQAFTCVNSGWIGLRVFFLSRSMATLHFVNNCCRIDVCDWVSAWRTGGSTVSSASSINHSLVCLYSRKNVVARTDHRGMADKDMMYGGTCSILRCVKCTTVLGTKLGNDLWCLEH